MEFDIPEVGDSGHIYLAMRHSAMASRQLAHGLDCCKPSPSLAKLSKTADAEAPPAQPQQGAATLGCARSIQTQLSVLAHMVPWDAQILRLCTLVGNQVAKLPDGRWIAGGLDGTIFIGRCPTHSSRRLSQITNARCYPGGRQNTMCVKK